MKKHFNIRVADWLCQLPFIFKPRQAASLIAGVVLATSVNAQQSADTDVSTQSETTQSGGLNQKDGAEQSASQWLEKLAETVSQRNFQVSFVLSRLGQETTPYLWRHAVLEDGTRMEQLNLQNGPGQEQIRVGDIVSVFEPDAQPYSVSSGAIHGPIPSALLYHPDSLKAAYKFVAVGRARISGRPAQQLRIISRDNTRFSYQMWLDEKTGMLLKFNTLDLQGSVLEQIQVTSLAISETPHPYFAKVNKESLPRPMASGTRDTPSHNWVPAYLPEGMQKVQQDVRRLPGTGQAVEYKMFSDGLVDVSVYVQNAKQGLGGDLALRHELNTFLSMRNGNVQVTIVGEIPLQTATAIAQSLQIKKPE
ncbi:MucB/RseB C-terminal domain-containing protein [Salinimonas chungwhensis]|uniref:MucB/RseB C-terminal domain-containing protein n=1 Tax=Salinimonas chungwhensis TaxID=265425 RepID=UPI00036D6F1F|nr:MucB/RseB C-terminal domain-containing protein [Salinimonas chungwhensis]